MAGLSIGGLGSGMDINGLVSQLVQAERAPQEGRLTIREGKIKTELSAIGTLKSALSDFQDSLANLAKLDTFEKRSVKLGSDSYFSASADETATAASYDIEVQQLAKSQKLASAGFADGADSVVGEGTLTLVVNGESMALDITSDNNSLAGIRDAINDSDDNPGVTASLVTDDSGTHLLLSADNTGTANSITVTVADSDGINTDASGLSQLAYDVSDPDPGNHIVQMSEAQAAKDSIVVIDGSLTVTSATNTVENAIEGVTLSLKEVSEKDDAGFFKPTSMDISLDKAGVKKTIESFVSSYNKLYGTLDELGRYDPETESAGPLQGDSTLRTLQGQLRRTLSESVDGLDNVLNNLPSLGISTSRDGKLELDKDVLDDQLDSNFDAIGQVFASENGTANKLDSFLKSYTQLNGLLDTRKDTLEMKKDRVADDRSTMYERMDAYEARLMKQFMAMDSAIAELSSSAGFLLDLATPISSGT